MVATLLPCGCVWARNYPLKLDAANEHILVDQKNVPFLFQGDCAWGLMVAVNRAEVEQYLENRRQKGFNTVVVMLISDHSYINSNATTNRYGVEPFTSGHDFTTPDEDYFRNTDWVIDLAGQKGIQVLLAPCYVGYDATEGWQNWMVWNGTNNCRGYGRYLGQRYKDKPNLIWLHSGDNGDPAYFPYIREIALGIREYDTNHLNTAKLWPEQSARDLLGGESWLDFNTTYAYGIEGFFTYTRRIYDKTQEDYNGSPSMPTFLVESTFEHEHGAEAYWVRRQAYWSVLSGSSGQVMGNYYIWPFYAGWQTAMDGAASVNMTHLKKLFDSRPWYSMVPDQNHTIITNGYGTFGTDDYMTPLGANNGSTIIAYIPTSRTFDVDMNKISGTQSSAWWFNPQDGSATNFATYPNSGSQSFTPPDTNDWILVLDDAAAALPSPGAAIGPLEVVTSALTLGAVGSGYSVQFLAEGGTPPYSWVAITNGAGWPSGMSFSTNGVFAGEPAAAGVFDLVMTVSDGASGVVTQGLRWWVEVPDTSPPTSPSGLAAMGVSPSEVDLNWLASTDNVGVTLYRVEGAAGADGTNFTVLGSVPGTNFHHMKLAAGLVWRYRVAARDAVGNVSGYSAVVSAMTLSPPAHVVGPVAAYDFEELFPMSGSSVLDWSGHVNTGVVNGAVGSAGRWGQGLAFGPWSWVDVKDSDWLDLVDGMTLEAWVCPTGGNGSWSTAVFKDQSGDLAYGLFPSSGVGLPNVSVITSSGLQGVNGLAALPLNVWSHLAGTYDGVSLRLYVNGVEVASAPASGSILTGTNGLFVGGNPDFGEFFVGSVDEVRVYNRALSRDEIVADMNDAPEVLGIDQAVWWPPRVNLSFTGAAGQSYEVDFRDALDEGDWAVLGGVDLPPVLTNWVVAGVGFGYGAGFYRVGYDGGMAGPPVELRLVEPGVLSFTGCVGQAYSVEYRAGLVVGSWQVLTNVSSPPVWTKGVVTDFAPSGTGRYYQLRNISPVGQAGSFTGVGFAVGRFDVGFNASPNRSYTVECRDALDAGPWQGLMSVIAPPVATNLVVSDFDVGRPQRFYRVKSP